MLVEPVHVLSAGILHVAQTDGRLVERLPGLVTAPVLRVVPAEITGS